RVRPAGGQRPRREPNARPGSAVRHPCNAELPGARRPAAAIAAGCPTPFLRPHRSEPFLFGPAFGGESSPLVRHGTPGTCAGTPYTCASPGQCQNPGTCNGDGTCSFTNKDNGASCNDGNERTSNDTCQGGVCVS